MVYVESLSESQRLMLCKLILEEFGPNIKHIAGVENIVSNTLSIFPPTFIYKHQPCSRKAQCRANDLFALGKIENNDDCFLLNLLIVQREKQK